MGDVVQIHVDVDQISPSASEGRARDHKVVMDRPEAKGGENKGAMGGENLLMALGGCFMSNLLAAAESRELEIGDVKMHITGTLDMAPPRFTAVIMEISARNSDKAQMEKLVIIAERGCIVANTLKGAVDLKILYFDRIGLIGSEGRIGLIGSEDRMGLIGTEDRYSLIGIDIQTDG